MYIEGSKEIIQDPMPNHIQNQLDYLRHRVDLRHAKEGLDKKMLLNYQKQLALKGMEEQNQGDITDNSVYLFDNSTGRAITLANEMVGKETRLGIFK